MSEPHLPDDLAAWPTDPYRLLGVDRDTEPRAIRKAYHQLIRRFKPEHAPEAFRRIREAFEATQRFDMRFFVRDEVVADSNPEDEPPASRLGPSPSPTPPDLWERACAGDLAGVYRGLVDRQERGSQAEDLFLQLYWLLVVAPELDPGQTPTDWLVRGLRAGGMRVGRLLELWRREAEVDPAGATEGASRRLLGAGTPLALASFVADWRWRSARRSERWGVIATDLDALRPWLPEASVAAWVRLLLLAAENVAWASGRTRDDRQAYRAEADRLAYDHALEIDDELSRYEYAEAVTDGLRQRGWAGVGDDGLDDLLRLGWDDRGSTCRPSLLAFAARLARVPEATLTRLDGVYRVAPAILGLYWEILGGDRGGWPDAPTAFAALAFLATTRWSNYPEFRVKLLGFCLRERVAPLVVARSIEDRADLLLPGNLPLGLAIDSDWPLLAAYRTVEIGWE